MLSAIVTESRKTVPNHMKSSVFQHIFNYISTYAHVFPEYLLHNFNDLNIKFHVML